jgi:1,4-dihydroxy-2-naphthoate octaprenyltransferase
MGLMAAILQVTGALALVVGLILALPVAWAVLAIGALTVVGGTVLEVGRRPRHVVVPGPIERRTAILNDYQRTASER